MSGKDSLRKKLEALAGDAARSKDGWRLIEGETETPAALAAAVAAEIDATVLPRRLSFRNEAGNVLPLEAGHRRLRRFLPPWPEALAPWKSLSEMARLDRVGDTGGIGEALAAHFGDDVAAWVKSETLQGAPAGGANTGLSARALLDAWQGAGARAPDEAVDPAEAVDTFLDRIAQVAELWAVVSEGRIEAVSEGADEFAATAEAAWDRAISADTAAGPICCVLERASGDAGCLVMAGDAERGIVARVGAASLGEIAAMWAELWA